MRRWTTKAGPAEQKKLPENSENFIHRDIPGSGMNFPVRRSRLRFAFSEAFFSSTQSFQVIGRNLLLFMKYQG